MSEKLKFVFISAFLFIPFYSCDFMKHQNKQITLDELISECGWEYECYESNRQFLEEALSLGELTQPQAIDAIVKLSISSKSMARLETILKGIDETEVWQHASLETMQLLEIVSRSDKFIDLSEGLRNAIRDSLNSRLQLNGELLDMERLVLFLDNIGCDKDSIEKVIFSYIPKDTSEAKQLLKISRVLNLHDSLFRDDPVFRVDSIFRLNEERNSIHAPY